MKPHPSPLPWIIAAAAIVFAAFGCCGFGVVFAIRMFEPGAPPGFRDYVKNPELWHELEAEQAEEPDLDAAKEWDDQKIEAAVRNYVLAKGTQKDRYVLDSLGPKTTPALLKVLGDKSLHSKLVTVSESSLLPDAPFHRICELLGESSPPEAIPLLVPFLDEKSEEIRKQAAFVLGRIGTASVVPSLRRALQDPDEYVRSYALLGLEQANEEARLSDGCRQELFPDVQQLLSDGKNSDHAALLLDMNKDKATEFFLSDAILAAKSKSLQNVLRALNGKGIAVPRDRLLILIKELESAPLEFPRDYQLGEALHALGKHQIPDDRAVLERFLSNPEEAVVEGAAGGMIASHGLDGLDDRIWKASGLAALTQPQRRYSAVKALDLEVRNGGFSQYFFNSSGDEWKSALAALEAMGSKERLELLQQALSKFDKSSPSESRNRRMEQLAKIESGNESVFRDLETRYYKSSENLDVLMLRYVLKNPDAFR